MSLEYEDIAAARHTSSRAICCGAIWLLCTLTSLFSFFLYYLDGPGWLHSYYWLCRAAGFEPSDRAGLRFAWALIGIGILALFLGNVGFWQDWIHHPRPETPPAEGSTENAEH
jgi:hypothetical protein